MRVVVTNSNEEVEEEIPIKRTLDNKRQRTDSEKRHQENSVSKIRSNNLGLFNNKDLEWLAWNWRSWNN